MKFVLPKNYHQFNKNQIGSKAFYLFKLKEKKIKTPNFFVLPASTIDALIHPIKNNIEIILQKNNLTDAAKEIENLFDQFTFSEKSIKELYKQLSTFFNKNTYFSVRSSAIDEDSSTYSFAGLHKSLLYTSKNTFLKHLKESIASAWSLNALSYREKHQISFHQIKIAIIVQEMVDAQKSGIGFSMNVQGNMADSILVAGFGLGEGIVTDLVATDSYFINRLDKTIKKHIVNKKEQLLFIDKKLILKKVAKKQQKQEVLSDIEIQKVSKILRLAEKMLDTIADIEFSFDKKGTLFILQMRPVTSISFSDVKILDNTNIGESYPEITLPLTFSFIKKSYYEVFKNASTHFSIPAKTRKNLDASFQDLLGYYQGRVYYRLDNWYKIMSQIYSSNQGIKTWEKAVGLKRDKLDKKHISFKNKLQLKGSIVLLLLKYKRNNRLFYKKFTKDYNSLAMYRSFKLPKEILQHAKQISSNINAYWYSTLINDLVAFKSFDLLQKAIVNFSIGAKELANDLISGQLNSDAEKAIVNLLSLKDTIENDKELSALFTLENSEIAQKINVLKYKKFKADCTNYLNTYGDRTLAELKLETISPKQDFHKFIDLLKSQLRSQTNLLKYQKQKEKIYKEASALVHQKLKFHPLKRKYLQFLKKCSIYALRNRENMRFARTRIYGVVKNMYSDIGIFMNQQKLLENPSDIFYLTVDEIELFSQHHLSLNYKKIVSKRKKGIDLFRSIEAPNRVIYNQTPPSNVLKTTSAKITDSLLKGTAVSKGKVTAKAKIMKVADYSQILKNKILVTKVTDPGWVFLMSQSVGLISEKGSLLSHTAIVGRELGIPVVVGVAHATTLIKDNDTISLDGNKGTVTMIT